MKTKIALLTLLLLSIYNLLIGQTKIADLGFGIKPGNEKGIFSFSFSFNRTEATEEDAGGYLWSKNPVLGKHDRVYLKPSAEANLGNVESSPNNILLELPLQYTIKTKPGRSFFFDLAPAFNASNTLDTGLYYIETGPQYLIYNTSNSVGFFVLPEFLFQLGKRYNKTVDNIFYRFTPSLQTSLLLVQNEDKTHRLEITTSIKLFFVDNDKLAPKNSMHLFSGSASYKLKNVPIGFTFKYINGYDQPLFKKLNAFTFGVSFYKK
jgi:hypothetical protein